RDCGLEAPRWVLPRRSINPGRDSEFGAKASDEIGQIVEAGSQRDFAHRLPAPYQGAGGKAQPGAQQPLMRGDSGHGSEGAQKMKTAESGDGGQFGDRVTFHKAGFQTPKHAGNTVLVSRRD